MSHRLIEVIRKEGAKNIQQQFYVGRISSKSPIKVKTNEIELDSDQLKIINKQQIISSLNINDEVLLIRQGANFIIVGKMEGV